MNLSSRKVPHATGKGQKFQEIITEAGIPSLDDNVLVHILPYLNYLERSRARRVNHQFKQLIDSCPPLIQKVTIKLAPIHIRGNLYISHRPSVECDHNSITFRVQADEHGPYLPLTFREKMFCLQYIQPERLLIYPESNKILTYLPTAIVKCVANQLQQPLLEVALDRLYADSEDQVRQAFMPFRGVQKLAVTDALVPLGWIANAAPTLPGLKRLKLRYAAEWVAENLNNTIADTTAMWSPLSECLELEDLYIDFPGNHEANLQVLRGLTVVTQLRTLDINPYFGYRNGEKELRTMLDGLIELAELRLRYCQVNWTVLANREFPSLQKLHMTQIVTYRHALVKEVEVFRTLFPNMTSLELEFDFDHTDMDEDGVVNVLTKLKRHPSLNKLGFACNGGCLKQKAIYTRLHKKLAPIEVSIINIANDFDMYNIAA